MTPLRAAVSNRLPPRELKDKMVYSKSILRTSVVKLAICALVVKAVGAQAAPGERIPLHGGNRTGYSKKWDTGYLVGQMISQVVTKYLAGCHLATVASGSSLLQPLIKNLFTGSHASVVVDASELFRINLKNRFRLLKGLWGHNKDTCRGLILDVTEVNAYSLLNLLEPSALWLQPNTAVLVVGKSGAVNDALFHPSLRNTLHTLYLALDDQTVRYLAARLCLLPACRDIKDWSQPAESYWRCLYCDNGNRAIKTYGRWHLQDGLPENVQLFQDQTRNFLGYTFNIVGLDFFPIMEYIPDSDRPGTTITLTDCLDNRILKAVAGALNFTYVIREPYDGEWGLDQDGNWTGIVGSLQHEVADFSLLLGLVYSRAQVMDFSSIYINDRWVIISLKNQPLTQYLSLVKPFTGHVWAGIITATTILGIVLWLVNRAWMSFSNSQGMSLPLSLLFSWGALLSNPTGTQPVNLAIRMVVSTLWIFSVVVSAAYRSSLIAHLTVRIFPEPINSFQDLVDSDGVTWGSEPLYGTEVLFFNYSLDPVVREFYTNLDFGTLDGHMERVMKGRHAYFASKTNIRSVIASKYTDNLGFTPLHFSQQQYPTSAGSVWGVRRGAPFNEALTKTRTRLTEVGLFDYWLADVINTRAKKIRDDIKKEGEIAFSFKQSSTEDDSGNQRVLSLNHLQVCFYLLFFGLILALFILLLETVLGCTLKVNGGLR